MIVPAKQDQGSEDQPSHPRQQDQSARQPASFVPDIGLNGSTAMGGKRTFLPSGFYGRVCKQARPTEEGNAPRRLGVAEFLTSY